MTSPTPCKRCHVRPKELPKHFCTVCLEVRLPPSEQATLAIQRAASWTGLSPGAEYIKQMREVGQQWCRGCGDYRVIDIFTHSIDKSTPPIIKMHVALGASRCRACIAVQRRQAVYGITPEKQAALLALQGGKCAICGRDQRMRALAVEHNHKTGDVRGFGCKSCNHDLLGSLHDSPELAMRALLYLLSPPARAIGIGPAPLTQSEIFEQIRALYGKVISE